MDGALATQTPLAKPSTPYMGPPTPIVLKASKVGGLNLDMSEKHLGADCLLFIGGSPRQNNTSC